MIDRRTLVTRSGVAAVLATMGIGKGGAQASPAALPARIENEPVDHQLLGHWLMYDQVNRELVGNFVEMWATDTECGFIMGDGLGGPREMIRFDQPNVIWAMNCMMRLMRRQATIDLRSE